jgi:hypothetical protein
MSGWRCLQVAVTSGPRATTWPMPLGDKPSHGARELTNKVRQPPLRRPHDSRRRSPRPRRPAASSRRWPLPVTTNSPVCQLMSSTEGRHLATARPQPRQHRQDRDVAASGAGPPITTLPEGRRPHPRRPRGPHRGHAKPEASLAVGVALQDVGNTFVDTPTTCWPTAMSSPSIPPLTPKLTT